MKQSCKKVLEEIAFVIQQFDDHEYKNELEFLHGNSVGKHIRHILEMFESVIEANESCFLNYDTRKRCSQTESSISFALEKINDLILQIDNLNLNKRIQLSQKLRNSSIHCETQINRELLFCFDHCIHHAMILKLVINHNFPHLSIPINFGMAYSTIQYNKSSET